MITTNTSLSFSTEDQSLWAPGKAINLYIDSGDFMIYDPDEQTKKFGFDIWVLEAEFTAYLDVKFGLLAWANLGSSGSWGASYELDVFVEHTNAVLGGGTMYFDFSSYDILAAKIASKGFGPGEDGISAGLKLIIEISAGVRDIYVDWPWPFGSDSYSGFSLIDIKEKIDLIKVNVKLPKFEFDLIDGIKLTAQLPQGANTKGSSEDSGVVSGSGTSDTNFLELSADLDKLMLKLLGKIPEPATQAVVKFLGETVFAEHTYDLGDYVGFIPSGKIKFEFTAIDITATAGLALTEAVELDITNTNNDAPDIAIMLTSDNGTPDFAGDDIRVFGKLGDKLTLTAPRTTTMNPNDPPTVGHALVTAQYSINRAHFSHDIGLALTFGITIDILKGALKGSWVPSFLEVSFGPLKQIKFPAKGEDGWEIDLGTYYSNDFEVDGSIFNTESDVYDVFYVQPEIAPTNWNPDLPGAEGVVYDYFEASHQQLNALFDKFEDRYPEDDFDQRPHFINGVPPISLPDYSDLSLFPAYNKVFFGWTGGFDAEVFINTSNDSMIMVAPSVSEIKDGPILQGNLKVKWFYERFGVGLAQIDLEYNTDWEQLFERLAVENDPTYSFHTVTYEYVLLGDSSGKIIQANGPTSAAGQDMGDLLLYNDGDFYDGGANINGQHDVFMANFEYLDGDFSVVWDLAKAIEEENNFDSSTMGGVKLGNGVTVVNVEALVIKTGAGDDYIVGGTFSDAISTGGGNDVVKLIYAIKVGDGYTVDVFDDFVSLGDGNDIATVEMGNIPIPQAEVFTDYILGGTGVDQVFVRSGLQGLRYNAHIFFSGPGFYSDVVGANGIGAEASHSSLEQFLGYVYRDIEANFGTAEETELKPLAYIEMMNGSREQGSIHISTDVEAVNVVIDTKWSGLGQGDDLMVFMGGSYYDGGVGGDDTFAADFSAYEFLMGTRGGLLLDITDDVSYFGATTIKGVDRIHIVGTTDADVVYGGALDDYIETGEGDDFLSGGDDNVGDTLYGGNGDDTIFWHDGGADTIDGGAGFDVLNIEADQVADTGGGSTSPDFKHGGSLTYKFYNAAGGTLSRLSSTSTVDVIYQALNYLRDGVVDSQGNTFNRSQMTYRNIEAINIIGSTAGNDIIVYQGGSYYDAGERTISDDRDTFAADFRGQETGIEFTLGGRYETEEGIVLANGVYVGGMERAVILGGEGHDVLSGGWLADMFVGGGGNDTLLGFGGNDVLMGGEGSDTFIYDSLGFDEIYGGTNEDESPELDHLIIAGSTWNTRVALRDEDGNDVLTADKGIVWAFSSREDIQDLAEKSMTAFEWQFYNHGVGNPTRWQSRSVSHVTYQGMEAVDIAGIDEFDDLIVYQGGVGYVGGERVGDADLFVADLRAFDDDLTLNMTYESGVGYDIGQGTQIADFERMHVLLGSGNDYVVGGDLDDTAKGGAGDDEMSGGLGNDHLYGEAGDDVFEHTGGNDEIYGGAGNDALSISDRNEALKLKFFDASDSKIGITYSMTGTPLTLADFAALYAITTDDYQVIEHGSSSVKFNGIEEVVISGGDKNDVLVGGSLQGVMFAGEGDDALIGRGGNDFMSGGRGNDVYVMGADFGNDLIFGEVGETSKLMFTAYNKADLKFGVSDTDLIVSVGGNSVRILGYFAANSTKGLDFEFEALDGVFNKTFPATGSKAVPAAPFTGDGVTIFGTNDDDDILEASDKSDLLRGFGGDDFFGSSKGADLIDGGAGRDAVSYLRSDAGVNIDLVNFTGTGGHADGDLLVSIEHLNGSLFDDVIQGNRFKNNIFGADGDDSLAGNDGDDYLSGDEGNDTVSGDAGNDLLYGNDGKDILYGGVGTDYLAGDDGKDTLYGGSGADILDDGYGSDTAYGDGGNDVFIYADGLDAWFGGAGLDTGDFDRFGAAIEVDLAGSTDITTRDGEDMETATGALRTLVSIDGFENIRGSIYHDRLTGDDVANRIEGNLGNDTITGHKGNDTLIGGAGIDTLDYSKETGNRGIIAKMGNPVREYVFDTHGNRDIVSGFEVVIGTDFADSILGNGLNNALFGGKGNDTALNGNGGNDSLFGGEGDDTLSGGDANDILLGGTGGDRAYGGNGDDLFIEELGSGRDTYDGGADFDTISYASLTGGIIVNVGSNLVSAGGEIDRIYNIENVVGGLGDDIMNGDSNDNWFSYFGGVDTFDGKSGSDTAVYSYFDAAVLVDLTATDEARTRDGSDLNSGAWRTITQMTSMENVVGSDFHDALIGSGGENMLFGGEGNDKLDGGLGDDVIFGGVGADFLVNDENNGSDLFDGGAGFDTLDYSAMTKWVSASLIDGDGDDIVVDVERLLGTDYDDTLKGNAANNVLQGGAGDDLLQADEGDDILVYTDGYDYFYGEGGNDTADYSLFGFAIDLDLRLQDAVSTRDTADWDVGTEREITLIYSLDVENAIGTDFNDRLNGDNNANKFNGGKGNDAIFGFGGDDMFTYAAGLDTWAGGAGLDTANFSTYRFAVSIDLSANDAKSKLAETLDTGAWTKLADFTRMENAIGSGFDDLLRGNAQQNTLSGFVGDDTLFGGGGDDTLLGDDGDDLLSGGAGADEIIGGNGADTASYSSAGAGVTLDLKAGTGTGGEASGDTFKDVENVIGTGFADTISGSDTDNTLNGGGGDDSLSGNGGKDMISGGKGSDTISGGDAEDKLLGEDGNDDLFGDGDDDQIFGGSGRDSMEGGEGNDTLFGGNDNDHLHGGRGKDTLNGGAGDDHFIGGEGDDTMTGGAGRDTFVLSIGMGTDVITDFAFGTDKLTFAGDSDVGMVVSATGGGDRLITLTDGSSVTLTGVPQNYAPTGNVTIDGGTDVGDLLTANASNVADADGLGALSFQWMRDGTAISGATGNTYTTVGDDGGATVTVDVSYVDGFGTSESLTSSGANIVLNDPFTGTAGNDTIIGNNSANTLKGLGGKDILSGKGGADKIFGGGGADKLNGQGGKDQLFGGGGKDVLKGGIGNDKLFGQTDNDKLFGGGGADVLKGGGGSDILRGNKGNDTLDGGAGKDTFIFNRGDGDDLIKNFNITLDTIQIGKGASVFSDLTIVKDGNDVDVSFANVSITLEGVKFVDVTENIFDF